MGMSRYKKKKKERKKEREIAYMHRKMALERAVGIKRKVEAEKKGDCQHQQAAGSLW